MNFQKLQVYIPTWIFGAKFSNKFFSSNGTNSQYFFLNFVIKIKWWCWLGCSPSSILWIISFACLPFVNGCSTRLSGPMSVKQVPGLDQSNAIDEGRKVGTLRDGPSPCGIYSSLAKPAPPRFFAVEKEGPSPTLCHMTKNDFLTCFSDFVLINHTVLKLWKSLIYLAPQFYLTKKKL